MRQLKEGTREEKAQPPSVRWALARLQIADERGDRRIEVSPEILAELLELAGVRRAA